MSCHWYELSDELKLVILSYAAPTRCDLAKVASVCRDFRRLAFDRTFWRVVQLAQMSVGTCEDACEFLERLEGAPRTLSLRDWQVEVNADELRRLLQLTPNLNKLDACESVSPDCAAGLTAMCGPGGALARLRELDLSRCCLSQAMVSGLAQLRHLEALTLDMAIFGSGEDADATLACVAELAPLSRLSLQSQWKMTEATCQEILSRHAGLRELSLERCSTAVTPSTLAHLGTTLGQLETLNISMCSQGTHEALEEMCVGLASGDRRAPLRTLLLAGCEYVVDATLDVLVEHFGVSLRAIDLSACRRLRDPGIGRFIEAVGPEGLERLSLSDIHRLTNASLQRLATHAPHLKRLDIDQCGYVRSDALLEIAQGCPRIERLSMKRVMKTRNGDFCAIVSALPSLTHLDVQSINNLLPESLVHLLVTRGAQLTHLDIGSIACSDAVLEAMVARASSLEYLSLRRCKGFSPEALERAFVALGPRLRFLDLFRCQGITDEVADVAWDHVRGTVNFAVKSTWRPSALGRDAYWSAREIVQQVGDRRFIRNLERLEQEA